MATEPLTIAYAGSLAFFDPQQAGQKSVLQKLLGTFQVDNLDVSTRSAYYLFAGVHHLLQTAPEYSAKLRLQFWGAIDKRTAAQAQQLGISACVRIEGYKSKPDSLAALQQADVLFLPLESEKNGQRPLFIPGKLYEYLATGKPVLAVAGASDCTEILQRAGTGIIVSPFDPAAIAAALKTLCDTRETLQELYLPDAAYIATFSFDRIAERMAAIFDAQLKR